MMLIFGVKIDTTSRAEARKRLADFFIDGRQHLIVTPNPEILLAAKKDRGLFEALNAADMSMPDGFGLLCALWFYGKSGHRFPGVEISQELIRLAVEKKEIIYFLGDEKGSAQKAALKFPDARIICENGPDFKAPKEEQEKKSALIISHINTVKPTVVLAAFGHTKQEKWLHEHLSKMPSVKIAIGVGGTFDFWAGTAHRAPKLFRILGLEWLWRLILEPRRWKRIFNAVIIFPIAVISAKMNR